MLNITRFAALGAFVAAGGANAAISLGDTSIYSENFNTLVSSGTGTAYNTLPTGWAISESGTSVRSNNAYAVDNGGSTTGDIFSYGATGSTDRALGSLLSGTLTPLFGASFTNTAATALQGLTISYSGEQWRYGATGRADTLTFQYSTNATSLTTGTWTTVSGLSFTGATFAAIGAKDGNANAQTISGSISGLDIATNGSIWLRYVDENVAGAEDGLGVDNFQLAATFAPQAPVPEPGEWAMMAAGLGVAGYAAKRRKTA